MGFSRRRSTGRCNDPRYNKTRCFEPFPFPTADTGLTPELSECIRKLAEKVDAHRKTRQAAHTAVQMTAVYNVLEKLRSGEVLTPTERTLNEQGQVGVLKSLHEELDTAVLKAYGWADLDLPADTPTLLERLVALTAKRTFEETSGTVHWLRPDFQQGRGEQMGIETDDAATSSDEEDDDESEADTPKAKVESTRIWPTGLTEQIMAVAEVMAQSGRDLDLAGVTGHFSGRGRWRDRLPTLLDTLVSLGRLRLTDGGRWIDAGR